MNGPNGETICHVFEELERETVEANFRLIAAAPDLLEVAYAVTQDDLDVVAMAQAAIAKAEGLAQ